MDKMYKTLKDIRIKDRYETYLKNKKRNKALVWMDYRVGDNGYNWLD